MLSFNIDTNLMNALNTHNNTNSSTRFSTLDGALLCLIKNSSDNFYFSNKFLASLFIADPGTIQRSIDKLVAAQFIAKDKEYINSRPRRHLYCNHSVVNQFVSDMKLLQEECDWDG